MKADYKQDIVKRLSAALLTCSELGVSGDREYVATLIKMLRAMSTTINGERIKDKRYMHLLAHYEILSTRKVYDVYLDGITNNILIEPIDEVTIDKCRDEGGVRIYINISPTKENFVNFVCANNDILYILKLFKDSADYLEDILNNEEEFPMLYRASKEELAVSICYMLMTDDAVFPTDNYNELIVSGIDNMFNGNTVDFFDESVREDSVPIIGFADFSTGKQYIIEISKDGKVQTAVCTNDIIKDQNNNLLVMFCNDNNDIVNDILELPSNRDYSIMDVIFEFKKILEENI